LSTLIQHLDTGETPLEALQRLNKNKPKETKVPKWKKKKQQQKDAMDIDDQPANGDGHTDPAEEARRKLVESITGAADALYSRGQLEIYEAEREILMRQYRRETGDDWQPPSAAAASADGNGSDTWEYRWSDGRDGGTINGPYDGPTMAAWNEAGYFGEGVEFRKAGESQWTPVLDVS
jgi:CD2 antigen cytoplasmic tail-binding protein 2